MELAIVAKVIFGDDTNPALSPAHHRLSFSSAFYSHPSYLPRPFPAAIPRENASFATLYLLCAW